MQDRISQDRRNLLHRTAGPYIWVIHDRCNLSQFRSMSASLIGRSGSSAFRLSTNTSVDVAHGLVLLFGIGTKALPSWDSKTRWHNLYRGLAVR